MRSRTHGGASNFGTRIADKTRMAHGTVVLLAGPPAERVTLEKLLSGFGWSLEVAESLDDLAALALGQSPVAVLFSPAHLALPWNHALRGVLRAAPGAFAILCHRFGDPIDWPQVAEAGAFHSLLMPFSESEVRQSMGFVWSVRFGSAARSGEALGSASAHGALSGITAGAALRAGR